MHYNNTKEIWDELRELCPIYYGATYEKMADWRIFNGLAQQKIAPVHNIFMKAVSSIPLMVKVNSILVSGRHLLINSLMSSQWYWHGS